jgi:hypothetical protein
MGCAGVREIGCAGVRGLGSGGLVPLFGEYVGWRGGLVPELGEYGLAMQHIAMFGGRDERPDGRATAWVVDPRASQADTLASEHC